MYQFEALPGKEKIEDPEFKEALDSIVREARCVLTIGWHDGSGYDLYRWLVENGKRVILIEAFWGNVEKFGCDGVEKIHGDCRDFQSLVGKESRDCVIWQDGPEHMDADQAVRLLKDFQREFKSIIISTPNGEYPQGVMDGNNWEVHRSTWFEANYRALGFQVLAYEAGLIGYWREPEFIGSNE
jgi:hypothetical protein